MHKHVLMRKKKSCKNMKDVVSDHELYYVVSFTLLWGLLGKISSFGLVLLIRF